MAEKKKGGRGVPAPSPQQAMARYYRVTGEPDILAGYTVASTEWGISGEYMDEAVVGINTTTGATSKTPIGRYNPATRKWSFAPEYIMRDEEPAMQRMMRAKGEAVIQQLNALRIDADQPVVDVYHPHTHKVRAELAQVAKGLGNFLGRPAVRAAMHAPNSPLIAVDNHTLSYPVMPTELFSGSVPVDEVADGTVSAPAIAFLPYNRLQMMATDVKVQNPTQSPGRTVRDSRTVTLARRSQDDPNIWVPNMDVLEPERDWPVVMRMVEVLETARHQNPDFSVLHCAVVYGGEYALTRMREDWI
jgi:hypothetical protein